MGPNTCELVYGMYGRRVCLCIGQEIGGCLLASTVGTLSKVFRPLMSAYIVTFPLKVALKYSPFHVYLSQTFLSEYTSTYYINTSLNTVHLYL